MGADMAVQRRLLTVLGVADVTLVGLQTEVEALVLRARPLLGEALVAVPALEGLLAGVGAPVGLQMFLHLNIQAVCTVYSLRRQTPLPSRHVPSPPPPLLRRPDRPRTQDLFLNADCLQRKKSQRIPVTLSTSTVSILSQKPFLDGCGLSYAEKSQKTRISVRKFKYFINRLPSL
jgi:hypothetical protein